MIQQIITKLFNILFYNIEYFFNFVGFNLIYITLVLFIITYFLITLVYHLYFVFSKITKIIYYNSLIKDTEFIFFKNSLSLIKLMKNRLYYYKNN